MRVVLWGVVLCSALVSVSSQKRPARLSLPERWNAARAKGADLADAKRWPEALAEYRAAAEQAKRENDPRAQLLFLSNVIACHVAQYEGREAAGAFEQARPLAERLQDWETLAILNLNLSMLHATLGDYDNAEGEASEAEQALLHRPQSSYLLPLRLHRARLLYWRHQYAEARELLNVPLRQARLTGDLPAQLVIQDQFALIALALRQDQQAEAAVREYARLRREQKKSPGEIYWARLAQLRRQQGTLPEALTCIDHAELEIRQAGPVRPVWSLPYERGLVLEGLHRDEEALAAYRTAIERSRAWRWGVVPAEQSLMASESGLQQLYGRYLDTGWRVFQRNPEATWPRESLRAAEENRAVALRQGVGDHSTWLRKLPLQYWEKLSKLRAVLAAELRQPSPEAAAAARELRVLLSRWETTAHLQAGLEQTPQDHKSRESIVGIQQELSPDEAVLVFTFTENNSYLWALDQQNVQLMLLPDRRELTEAAVRFRAALQERNADTGSSSRALYGLLFSGVSGPLRDRRRWIVVPDGPLQGIPWGALEVQDAGKPVRYLIQDHTIQICPSLLYLGSPRVPGKHEGFLAVGDPVYDRTDERWRSERHWTARAWAWGTGWVKRGADRIVLGRLPGGGREARECARIWQQSGQPVRVLTGPEVRRDRIAAELQKGTAVAHFAVHMLQTGNRPEDAFLALGLDREGGLDYLTTSDVAHLTLRGGLIVLNGCASGQGRALPGEGWIGMTRAWLLAGARDVVATHWETLDESSPLFLQFYRDYAASAGTRFAAAEALRSAQLTMLQSSGWRSRPQYWGAYFVVGKG